MTYQNVEAIMRHTNKLARRLIQNHNCGNQNCPVNDERETLLGCGFLCRTVYEIPTIRNDRRRVNLLVCGINPNYNEDEAFEIQTFEDSYDATHAFNFYHNNHFQHILDFLHGNVEFAIPLPNNAVPQNVVFADALPFVSQHGTLVSHLYENHPEIRMIAEDNFTANLLYYRPKAVICHGSLWHWKILPTLYETNPPVPQHVAYNYINGFLNLNTRIISTSMFLNARFPQQLRYIHQEFAPFLQTTLQEAFD